MFFAKKVRNQRLHSAGSEEGGGVVFGDEAGGGDVLVLFVDEKVDV